MVPFTFIHLIQTHWGLCSIWQIHRTHFELHRTILNCWCIHLYSNQKRKKTHLFKGCENMATLFIHTGSTSKNGAFKVTITKIWRALSNRTNKIVQGNLLLDKFSSGSKSFNKIVSWNGKYCKIVWSSWLQ